MAVKEFIVAIELGSSKITGIAGKKNLDGSINVLSVVQESSTQCIRKGVVYNIDKTSQVLTNIIKKLKQNLKSEIAHVYVGIGGQSIHSVKNVIVKQLPEETIITQDMINELMDNNRNMTYPDQEILDAATQEYKVGNQYQIDPVGVQSKKLEGNFLNILCRKSFYQGMNKCFDKAGIAIAEMYLAPLALADSVLSEAEKRGGCVLVDLGADTTTVAVYHKSILRHLAVIPLGSNNVTKDLTILKMEEDDAEAMKLKYGSAYTNYEEIDNDKKYPINSERSVPMHQFVQIVEARIEEIVANVWNQVPSDYTNRLLGGIILTGGGSNMKNIKQAFSQFTHIDKIRVASTINQAINLNANITDLNTNDGRLNTVLGLLAKGDMNCAGSPIVKAPGIFDETHGATTKTTEDLHRVARPAGQVEGKVMTEAERKAKEAERKAQEEAERKAQEEAERKAQEEAERKAQEEAEARKNNLWNRSWRNLKKFTQKLITEDEEDDKK